ncbi:MAG: membrane protein insertase YidC [bacterium]
MEDQSKRLFLTLAISFIFLFVYQYYFVTPQKEQQGSPVVEEGAQAPEIAEVETVPIQEAPGKTAEQMVAGEEKTIRVDTPLYTAVLTNRGGVLKSVILKNFLQDMKDPDSRVQLVRDPSGTDFPLKAELIGVGGPLGFAQALFLVDGGDVVLEEGEEGSVTFSYRTHDGFEMIKSLTFSGSSYAVDGQVRLVNRSTEPISGRLVYSWTPGLEVLEEKSGSMMTGRYGFKGAVVRTEGKSKKIKSKKLEGTELYEEFPDWVASQDMYFVAAMLPRNGSERAIVRKMVDGRVAIGLYTQVKLEPGTAMSLKALTYMGPKEMDSLKAVDPSLAETVDMGFFAFIAKPLLVIMNYFYRYVGNYGIAIIILTILIKIVFIPFSNASFKSMKNMSKLQPQINELKDKHKKDKEKLNQAIMGLYKENKVNPAGGCLPILVQIPVFFALYRALLGAIELRHAPFMLWIADLSAKDPLYITPIVMGATMFLQQKMTPATGDPRQQQIMLFMPIVFTALFVNLPSGLVIYWTVNNILTIGHQYYMLKGYKAKEAKEAAEVPEKPAAKKKSKKGRK